MCRSSLLVGQGGPLDWAYVHRIHHRLCEHGLDYHSPRNADASHAVGFLGIKGFLYSHAGWLITPHPHVRRSPKLERYLVPDIVLDPDLLEFNEWVDHHPLMSKGVCGWILPAVLLALGHVLYLCHKRRNHHQQQPKPQQHGGGGAMSVSAGEAQAAADGDATPPKAPVAATDDGDELTVENGGAKPAIATTTARGGSGGVAATRPSIIGVLLSSYVFAVYYFYFPVALTWMSTSFVNSATYVHGPRRCADCC